MASCREVVRSLASGELGDAGIRRKVATRLHLLWCSHCRRYAKQLALIGRASKVALQPGPQEREVQERLEESVLKAVDDPPSADM